MVAKVIYHVQRIKWTRKGHDRVAGGHAAVEGREAHERDGHYLSEKE